MSYKMTALQKVCLLIGILCLIAMFLLVCSRIQHKETEDIIARVDQYLYDRGR